MKLTLVIEGAKGSDIGQKIIRWMRRRPAGGDRRRAGNPGAVQASVRAPLNSIELIRRSRPSRGWRAVASISPDTRWRATTSSSLTICFRLRSTPFRQPVQLSHEDLGRFQPLGERELKHNLATICERYGGGGHAKVGAISFEPGELEKARRVAGGNRGRVENSNVAVGWGRQFCCSRLFSRLYEAAHPPREGRVKTRLQAELPAPPVKGNLRAAQRKCWFLLIRTEELQSDRYANAFMAG